MRYWHDQQEKYRRNRKETVTMFSGSPQFGQSLGLELCDADKPWGNLMQLSGRAHAIKLAYGDPRYMAVAQTPAADSIAPRLKEFLNRYTPLIGLGDTARQVALDSFFGWGIFWTGPGILPPGARMATGQVAGPMVWRVSQDNFLFDGTATSWEYVSYIARLITVPLQEAREYPKFLSFNAKGTNQLEEWTQQNGQTDSRMNVGASRQTSPQAMTRLAEVYLPHSGQTVYWAANSIAFTGVSEMPLLVEKYVGHHSGPASVVSLLDIPDNLAPVALCESTKKLHNLYNDIAEITANQAKAAKYNPVYEIGSQRDMEKLQKAEDREPVPVSNISKISGWQIPGPDQSQTMAQHATLQLFKEFSGNTDDTLGQGVTAPTATQSALIRQQTNAVGAEARRRMDRAMDSVARKLAHLVLNDPQMQMPMRTPLRGAPGITTDVSWLPPSILPRNPNADDYLITLVQGSMEFRDPQQRLASINEAMGQIIQAAQAVAQGIPLDIEKFIDLQAEYRDLPELRDLYMALMPQVQMAKQESSFEPPDPTKGVYTRINQSTQSNAGALAQNMGQMPGQDAPPIGARGGMIRVA